MTRRRLPPSRRPPWLQTSLEILCLLGLIASAITCVSAAPATSGAGMQQQQQHPNNGSCPSMCECPGTFYVYCQSSGLKDHHVTEIVSQVSASIVLLDLSANQITSLQPEAFKRLPNLQYLYLSANHIEEIPTKAFRCLFWLKQLTLHNNRITNTHADSFFDLIRIQSLDLSDNNISYVPHETFTNLKTLEKLHLQQNSFSELRSQMFLGLDNLQLLNVSHNSVLGVIQNNTFAGLAKLKTLDLSHNLLSSLSASTFKGLTSLSELHLDHNSIRDISFLGNTEVLRRTNNVNAIDFQRSLTGLSLTHNRLEVIPSKVFPSLPSLKRLLLSHNSVSLVEPAAFANLVLDKLSLSQNSLADLDRDVFSGVRRVSELDLSGNRISGFSSGIFDSFRDNSPFSVDLSQNQLTYIHSGLFREMRTLRLLNLSGNSISVIDSGALDDLELLEELDLSHNRLTLVTPGMVSGPTKTLRKLRLRENPLNSIQGFAFYHQDDRLLIETEAKISKLASTWAVVTWPYRDGSQLYWSLVVRCDHRPYSSSSSSSNISSVANSQSPSAASSSHSSNRKHSNDDGAYSSCKLPAEDEVLEPFRKKVNISGLSPDSLYTVCVLPVFVSTDVVVTQCVHMRTKPEQTPVTPNSVVDGQSSANSAWPQRSRDSSAIHIIFSQFFLYAFIILTFS